MLTSKEHTEKVTRLREVNKQLYDIKEMTKLRYGLAAVPATYNRIQNLSEERANLMKEIFGGEPWETNE